ncbi:MAG TPA: aminodeoxychorismate synthase component I, partial [Saprospiraceae bacterium]|nr:aminodeoxychorismate synthase component I [Saprospiraceae bacterium]
MTRVVKKISINKPNHLGDQLLVWAKEYFTFAWLDSNNYPQDYSTFDKVLAVGVKSELMTDSKNAFSKLDRYQQHIKDYIFGYLTYDLKNDTENLSSKNSDHLAFPDLYFFQPLKI